MEAHETPSAVGKIETPLPPEGSVYDYLFEAKGRGKWTPWLDFIKDKSINPNIKQLSEIIVPTLDTVRYVHLPFHACQLESVEVLDSTKASIFALFIFL